MTQVLRLASLSFLVVVLLVPTTPAQTTDGTRTVVLTTASPYWGYVRSPYAAALFGMADLTRANGEYQESIQRAALAREKTRRDRLKTNKAVLQSMKWEREFILQWREEETERAIKYELKRAIDRPTMTEVIAGTMLNRLISDLGKVSRPPDASSSSIPEEALQNINFTATGGNTGLLRQKDLPWPMFLTDSKFNHIRSDIEANLDQARDDAKRGRVSGETYQQLLVLSKKLDDTLTDEMRKPNSLWQPRHHIQAMRFGKELNQSLLMLENPKEAAFLLNLRPNSKTVLELVQFMREHGLRFAPASAGNERHYMTLHTVIADEARRFQKQSSIDR